MRAGFMGMGIMGALMARNVRKAGFELQIYNRSAEKCAPLRDEGVTVAQTPHALAEWADVLIIMVTGPEAVENLLFGQDGATGAMESGKLVVNMSTVPPSWSKGVAARIAGTGAGFVEAPVLGSRKPAEEGTLVVLAAGKEDDVQRVTPLLESMGKKVVPCGETPRATTLKLAVNLLLGAQITALSEMLDFAEKAGLERDMVLNVVMAGPLSNTFYSVKEPMLRSREFPVEFPLEHMAKDLGFAVQTADEHGAAAPLARELSRLYELGKKQGLSREDFAAIGNIL